MKCSNCNSEVKKGEKKCTKCGATLIRKQSKIKQKKVVAKRPISIVLISLVGALFLIVLLASILPFERETFLNSISLVFVSISPILLIVFFVLIFRNRRRNSRRMVGFIIAIFATFSIFISAISLSVVSIDHFSQANSYFEDKRYEMAISNYEIVIEENKDPEQVSYSIQKVEEAESFIDEANLYIERGDKYYDNSQFDLALSEYEIAKEIYPYMSELDNKISDCNREIEERRTIEEQKEEEIVVNNPPVAIITYNEEELIKNNEITLSAESSKDPDGDDLQYEWQLPNDEIAETQKVSVVFDEYGKYNIKLKVSDGSLSDTVTEILNVENNPPVAKVNDTHIYCKNNETIKLTAEESFDPNDDELYFKWTLPDGTVKEKMEIEYTPTSFGTEVIILNVSDGDYEDSLNITLEITESQASFKASCENVTYDDLLRNPEDYYSERIHLKGEIVQKISDNEFHINITKGSWDFWDDRTWLITYNAIDQPTLIENDIIEVWGFGEMTATYETIMGAENTIPVVSAKYIELLVKAGDR